jgi:hypothetical protein
VVGKTIAAFPADGIHPQKNISLFDGSSICLIWSMLFESTKKRDKVMKSVFRSLFVGLIGIALITAQPAFNQVGLPQIEKASLAGDEFWDSQFVLGVAFTAQPESRGIYAVAVSGANVYVGGDFFSAGGLPGTGFAAWYLSPKAWIAVGTALSNCGIGPCRVNAIDSSTNFGIAAGGKSSGTTTVNRVAWFTAANGRGSGAAWTIRFMPLPMTVNSCA